MAETDGKILVEIVLDDGSIQKGFVKMRDEAKKTGAELSSSLDAGFSKLAVAATAAASAIGAALFSRAAIEAAAQQESAIQRLNQSLANAGRYSQQTSQDFVNLAQEIQKTTTLEDDAALGLSALANNFAQTNEQAKLLTKAAIDLSAATGMNLETAVESLGKTLSGNLGLLGRSVPALQELTKEQLKSGDALNIVLNRFGGSAASQVNTFSGALTQAKNAFGDLQEEVGGFIVQDKVFIALLKGIAQGFSSASESVAKLRENSNGTTTAFGNLLISLVKFGEIVNKFLIAPMELFFNLVKIGFQTIYTGLTAVYAGFINLADKFNQILPDLDIFKGMKEQTAADAAEVNQTLATQFDSLATSIDESLNLKVSGSTALFLDNLRTNMENASSITQEFKNNATANFNDTTKVISDRVKTINQLFSQGLVNAISAGANNIGTSLQKGTLSFESFALSVIGSLGDMSISIGTNLIAQGVGINALAASLASLQGGAAIAAGASLVALGAALKAMAGGSGQTAATPAGSAGISAGISTQPSPATEMTPVAETVREANTQVVVNIQGDVLDSDSTGSRIVSLINDAFDKKGVQIRRGVTA